MQYTRTTGYVTLKGLQEDIDILISSNYNIDIVITGDIYNDKTNYLIVYSKKS